MPRVGGGHEQGGSAASAGACRAEVAVLKDLESAQDLRDGGVAHGLTHATRVIL